MNTGSKSTKPSRTLAAMKYGVNTMVWTTRITEQHSALFSRIREWGLDGVELFLSPSEPASIPRSEEHTSELQSRLHLVCRLLLEKKKDPRISSPSPPSPT